MYAVIKAGGKQQKVKPGDIIEVEYMHGVDEAVTFRPLLVVDDDGSVHYGREAERAVVTAKPVAERKGDKLHVFKYKSKSGYARRRGHRQLMTLLEISEVSLPRASSRKRAAAEETAGGQAEPEGDEGV